MMLEVIVHYANLGTADYVQVLPLTLVLQPIVVFVIKIIAVFLFLILLFLSS